MKRAFALLLGLAALALGANRVTGGDGPAFAPPPTSPKCPEHLAEWKAFVRGDVALPQQVPVTSVPAAGPFSDVPEAHDCQRLVSRLGDGRLAYGPLGVLFASHPMPTQFTQAGASRYQTMERASATIYLEAREGYPALKLGAYWSCLHIVRREILSRRFAEWFGGQLAGGSPGDSLRALLTVLRSAREAPPERPEAPSRAFRDDLAYLSTRLRADRSPTDSLRSIRDVLGAVAQPPAARPHPPSHAYTAVIQPADSPAQCAHRLPPSFLTESAMQSQGLQVHATPISALASPQLLERETRPRGGVLGLADVSAARWDGDFGHGGRSQHISVRCGDAWCDVMPIDAAGPVPDLVPAALRDSMPAALRESAPARTELKGWYDQQYLAERDPADTSRLVPGRVLGTYAPVDSLADRPKEAFDVWRIVGYIHLDGPSPVYKAKLNLSEGVNEVYMIRGRRPDDVALGGTCTPPRPSQGYVNEEWWVKIRAADGQEMMYCSFRHPHPATSPMFPGLARWRWLDEDEETWQRCPEGCCPTG